MGLIRTAVRRFGRRRALTVPFALRVSFAYCAGLFVVGLVSATIYVATTQRQIDRQTNAETRQLARTVSEALRNSLFVESEATLRGRAEAIADLLTFAVSERSAEGTQGIELRSYLTSQEISETGYFYAIDTNGIVTSHPFEELVGTSVADEDVFAQISSSSEGFIAYDWANPGEVDPREKIAYSVFVPALGLYVAASDYVQTIPGRLAPGRIDAMLDSLVSELVPGVSAWSLGGAREVASSGTDAALQAIEESRASDVLDSSLSRQFIVARTAMSDLGLEVGIAVDRTFHDDFNSFLLPTSFAGLILSFGVVVLISRTIAKRIAAPLSWLNDRVVRESGMNWKSDRHTAAPNVARLVLDQLRLLTRLSSETDRRQRVEEHLIISETAFNQAGEGICVTDESGTILRVNPAFERITGCTTAEVIGQNPRILKSTRHTPEFYEELWRSITTNGRWSGEIWNKRRDGTEYPQLLTIERTEPDEAGNRSYVAVFHDLTELREISDRLIHAETHDSLTGLPNKAYLSVSLRESIRRASRTKSTLGLLFLDIDQFKDVNESYGHDAGDRLLQWVAARIEYQLRGDDIAFRFGDDEFAILLHDVKSVEQLPSIARRMLAAVHEPYSIHGNTIRPSVSVGISTYPESGNDASELMSSADAALTAAKASGRNEFRIHDPYMNRAAHRRLHMQAAIGGAMHRREINPVYQPIFDLRTNRVVGAEALARWTNGDVVVPPGDFLPFIEETSSITNLDLWILESALSGIAESELLPEDFYVSVNAAPIDLTTPGFAERLIATIKESPCDPARLRVEITETAAIRDFETARQTVREIAEAGVGIYLDDFGEGYSSIRYLREFAVDAVKLDRAYVEAVGESDAARSLVRGFVELVHGIGGLTVIEGVESERQTRFLVSCGADMAQGYFFGRPANINELEDYFVPAGKGNEESVVQKRR